MKDFFGDMEFYRKSNYDKVVEMGEMFVRLWGMCLGVFFDFFVFMVMVGLFLGLNIYFQVNIFFRNLKFFELLYYYVVYVLICKFIFYLKYCIM